VEIVLAVALIGIVVATIWTIRQGAPKDGEALPGNRDRTDLGGP
jgi:hypothetical protein